MVVNVDTNAAAVSVGVPSGTIRRWAHHGWLTRQGRDGRGRTLYDLGQVERVAKRVGRWDG
jgi:DNA-binding transcriptional MerR regulator